ALPPTPGWEFEYLIMVPSYAGLNTWLVGPFPPYDWKRALVGKATATPKSKTLGKRKSKPSPPRRRVLDNADFVIHG
ncbi:MAG: hypothetical protein LAP86_22900, partial [Acidobacteriia bacterium]|nr:hypothetical protein [Terriglobia bacterium]